MGRGTMKAWLNQVDRPFLNYKRPIFNYTVVEIIQ